MMHVDLESKQHWSQMTMVLRLCLIVTCFVFACSDAFAQAGNNKPADDRESQQGIILETAVLSQGYCRSDNLHLHLLLKYTNVGPEPRILYKHTFGIFRHLVSSDSAAALKEKYQYKPSLQINVTMPDAIDSAVPNSSLFAILKPNESHSLEVNVHLLIDNGREYSGKFLKPGKHALQLLVGTWYRDPALARTLAARWRTYGALQWWNIKSEPMEFSIEPFKGVIDCYGERDIGLRSDPAACQHTLLHVSFNPAVRKGIDSAGKITIFRVG